MVFIISRQLVGMPKKLRCSVGKTTWRPVKNVTYCQTQMCGDLLEFHSEILTSYFLFSFFHTLWILLGLFRV